jgi:beta-glucanase (GH16 family)
MRISARVTSSILLGVVLALSLGARATVRDASPAQPHALFVASSALTFDDEFAGHALSLARWNVVDVGGPGYSNPNLVYGDQRYTRRQVSVQRGVLDLATSAPIPDGTYPSGAVTTEGKWHMLYGTLDVRAKLARGQALWPAIWLLPAGQGCCSWSYEIDPMEMLGRDPHVVFFTVHWANGTKQRQCSYQGPDFSASFHTFSLIWRPGFAQWRIDEVTRCIVRGSFVSPVPMYLLIDVAVGGSWGGWPDDSTGAALPQHMLIDYVRAWR